MTRRARIAVYVACLLVLTFYFVQASRISTNHTDGGLILTYIDDMARGLRPHFDFIDAYGILNWPIPLLFYKLAGNQEWGIRIWLVLLKLCIVAASYVLVRRLAGTLYGVLAAFMMALLFGQAWHALQTAYAFNNVVPIVLLVWFVLLVRPFKRPTLNYVVGGVLTGASIWMKVNSGLFVLAGGLFFLFYWLPAPAGTEPTAWDRRFQSAFRSVRDIGLVGYGVVFYLYLRRAFDASYFVYMMAPLLIGLAYTWRQQSLDANRELHVRHQLRAWAIYFAAAVATVVVVLLAVTRVTEALHYLREQADIFRPLTYDMPFPLLGVPDEYIGFNENFWPQLPWLMPMVFLVWIGLQHGGRPQAAFGSEWREAQARAAGLYVMATLYLFVIYSRADETHIFQAMIGVPVAVCALLGQIEALLLRSKEQESLVMRGTLTATLVLWGSTIMVKPGFKVFDLSTGERSHPVLSYLHYRELNNPYIRDYSPDLTDHDWDRTMDDAAKYVDSLTDNGETVLVLDANRLFHIVSNTRPVGGRYHFYFYMLSTKLFDRQGYEKSVPPSVLQNILDHPPKVVVGADERLPPIAGAFPEIRHMVTEQFRLTRRFRHVLIFERKDIADAHAAM